MKFLIRSKVNVISQEDFPNNEKWTRCKYPNEKSTYPASCMTPAPVNYMLK